MSALKKYFESLIGKKIKRRMIVFDGQEVRVKDWDYSCGILRAVIEGYERENQLSKMKPLGYTV